jgi:hypothetical protein
MGDLVHIVRPIDPGEDVVSAALFAVRKVECFYVKVLIQVSAGKLVQLLAGVVADDRAIFRVNKIFANSLVVLPEPVGPAIKIFSKDFLRVSRLLREISTPLLKRDAISVSSPKAALNGFAPREPPSSASKSPSISITVFITCDYFFWKAVFRLRAMSRSTSRATSIVLKAT